MTEQIAPTTEPMEVRVHGWNGHRVGSTLRPTGCYLTSYIPEVSKRELEVLVVATVLGQPRRGRLAV
jgi:hypothetical protein